MRVLNAWGLVIILGMSLLLLSLFAWLAQKVKKRWFDGDPREQVPEGEPQVIDSVEIGIGVTNDREDN